MTKLSLAPNSHRTANSHPIIGRVNRPLGLKNFFVMAFRASVGGLKSSVTALPYTNFKIEVLFHSCLYPHTDRLLQIKTNCLMKKNCWNTACASS